MSEDPWYEQLRSEFRPDAVRVLLIAESAPDPAGGDRRFFYSPTLTAHDNLFRGVAKAAYGLEKDALRAAGKQAILRRLQEDGFWMIDAVESPVNHLSDPARRALIRDSVPALLSATRRIAPTQGVFICKAPLYGQIADALRQDGVIILNRGPAPFPLGNTRAEFVECWRRDIPPR